MNESEKIDWLVEMFEWDNSMEARYHALRILRQARGEPIPTFDDFKVKGSRQ